MTWSLRRAAHALLVALVALLCLLPGSAAHAAEESTISGTVLGPEGEAIAGVSLTVQGEGFSGTATTAADGSYSFSVPGHGEYAMVVDTATLPDGLSLAKAGDAERTVLVVSDEKRVLFKLITGETPVADAPATPGTQATTQEPVESAGPGFGTWGRVAQLVVDGLFLALLIALGALGLNLIFGTTGLTNFSHGELLTLGAFTALTLNEFGINIVIAAPIAILISAFAFGWAQNRYLWRPLRRRRTGLIPSMIVTIGLAIVLRYGVQLIWGGETRTYEQFAAQAGLVFGPVSITPKQLILAALAAITIAATVIWLQRSRIGKATRAVSDNPALASATGIDVERVISVVWTVGAGLAAFAGIYLGMTQDVYWNMGQRLLLIMFAAVTLGGLGTIYGALLGALIIGLFVQLSTFIIPPEMKYVGALFVMIVILLIRPQGILGRRERVG